jgi:hypothetical protein
MLDNSLLIVKKKPTEGNRGLKVVPVAESKNQRV